MIFSVNYSGCNLLTVPESNAVIGGGKARFFTLNYSLQLLI